MASIQDRSPTPTDNQASIALLRRLRAGDDVHFVHHIDVCTAPPEILVADLEPVPATGLDDNGYKNIWYFYHAKKYKNSRGDTSGHRQRAVTGGDGASWHQESRKDVERSGGGTLCSLSYGIKTDPSAPVDRLGWCMAEYDDKKQDGAADDSSNYVLCKVYRSSRAKGKSASASASSSSKTKKQTTKKRKAGGGDHREAPPAKLIQHQEPPVPAKLIQHQEPQVHQEAAYYPMPCYQPEYVQEVAVQQPTGPGGDFNFDIEDINFFVDESMLRDEPEPGQRQPTISEPEHDGRFIHLPCGPVLATEACIVGDMLGPKTAVKPQRRAESEHEHGDMEEFTVEWLLRGQPIVEPTPGHGSEFIQMPLGPVVPVVAEATVDDTLGFGSETMHGQWNGGMTTASIPWSSYAPTSSLYTGCNSLLQGPDPHRIPYLTC